MAGFIVSARAAMPAASGAANEVPQWSVAALFMSPARTQPGAATSTHGPYCEKLIRLPAESDAPTLRTPGNAAGYDGCVVLLFPAAATIMTPCDRAFEIAEASVGSL